MGVEAVRLHGWSLSARLGVVFGLAILPAACFLVYDLISHTVEQVSLARERTSTVVRHLAQRHEQLIQQTRTLLVATAALPQIRSGSDVCREALQGLLPPEGPYVDLTWAGPDGRVRCSARHVDPSADIGDRRYFQQAMQTRDFSIGDYVLGRVTGIPIVIFGYPVADRSGDIEGVLGTGVALSFLEQALAESGLPHGSVLVLLGSGGELLARVPRMAGSPVAPAELARAFATGQSQGDLDIVAPDGVRRLISYSRLGNSGNAPYMIAGIPAAAVYVPVLQRLIIYLLVLVVITVGAYVIAGRFGRDYVVQPITDVRDATALIKGGDLSARANPKRAFREAGELASAFNEMAGSIQDQLSRIHRLNRVYEVLSAINGALLRIRDYQSLIAEVTRIAVQKGQFALVLIAKSGSAAFLDELLSTSSADSEAFALLRDLMTRSRALIWVDVRSGVLGGDPAVVNDLRHRRDDEVANYLASLGLGSMAFLPVKAPGESWLVLCLGATEDNFFDEAEMKLLRELAADAGLGLHYIDQASRLDFLERFDPVTGLPNREHFEGYLAQVLSRAEHRSRYAAILTLDVNDYRRIVDATGKHIGDAILQRLADYLSSCLREGDLVAVLGRDTFGVILCDLRNETDAADVLEKIMSDLPSRVQAGAEEVFFTMRVGAALYPRDGDSSIALLSNAELAMQSVRGQAGTSFAFHSKGADTEAHERIKIESALRSANYDKELWVAYQPVISMDTGRIVSAEALMRWNSPVLGAVSPARFIPIAEHRNLILPMGDWILESVARVYADWRSRGLPPMHCAVNASMRQLTDPRFPDRVAEILRAAGLVAADQALTVEITESQLMEAPDKVLEVLERLRSMGLSLAIDDFGTGYSSLSYLTRLPVSTLKIDQSFVASIGTPSGLAVVKAVINLAHALDLRVIAEGVETESQRDELARLHCDEAQGYLFGKPMSIAEFEQLITAKSPKSA